jgi:hypothetical protein
LTFWRLTFCTFTKKHSAKSFVENRQVRRNEQGCQIFLDTIYQSGEKYTKWRENYQTPIKYTYPMIVKYSKLTEYLTTFSIPRSSIIFPNWYFGQKWNHLATLEMNAVNVMDEVGCKLSLIRSLTEYAFEYVHT